LQFSTRSRWLLALALAPVSWSQMTSPGASEPMHDHDHGMHMNQAGMYLMTLASGTSMNPQSWAMPMLMPRLGSWSLMLMGQAFVVDTQQSGPRGGDKFYSVNWGMISAEHSIGRGSLMFETMLSLDPATVTRERYPLLFQTGETAYGVPLVDAQHPHDFFMSIAAHYARAISDDTMLHFYYAPVGDPALGPVAFPHRASAFELPQATLSHHLQDSTHIANNVATVALKHKWLRLEASGFYGTEPNENRWNIDWGGMNSYSGRVSVLPSKNWLVQVSAGRITAPERQAGHGADIVRTTASAHYNRPLDGGNSWSTSFIWGQNHNITTRQNLNSYLVESVYPIGLKNFLTGRLEVVDKDELFPRGPDDVFRIAAYTLGYTRDIATVRNIEIGVGANATAYSIPDAIKPYYGDRPLGANFFLRFRLKPTQ
jgi:hypothetical protein